MPLRLRALPRCGFALLALCLPVSLALAAEILTAADLEKVSGYSDLITAPKGASAQAAGDLNFAREDGRIVLIVMIQPEEIYARWQMKFGADGQVIPGIGEAAFRPGEHSPVNFVVFKKGAQAVWLQSMGWNQRMMQNFDYDQLIELAKIAAGRM